MGHADRVSTLIQCWIPSPLPSHLSTQLLPEHFYTHTLGDMYFHFCVVLIVAIENLSHAMLET